jgi:transposase
VVQVNDLSRSLAAFDPISTLVVVVEMSKASWLVSSVCWPLLFDKFIPP